MSASGSGARRYWKTLSVPWASVPPRPPARHHPEELPTGTSFAEHVTRRRLQECRSALERPTAARSITDVAFAWGFANLTTFYRAFRREFGMAPGDLRLARA
ncbi:MAG: helix-turn-helix transcriptional regulator [Acetobacteraceae bacterium]|nr:helix-turn-helix transcriptional regulator [Acetobacteraceae bacterium]